MWGTGGRCYAAVATEHALYTFRLHRGPHRPPIWSRWRRTTLSSGGSASLKTARASAFEECSCCCSQTAAAELRGAALEYCKLRGAPDAAGTTLSALAPAAAASAALSAPKRGRCCRRIHRRWQLLLQEALDFSRHLGLAAHTQTMTMQCLLFISCNAMRVVLLVMHLHAMS